MRQRQRTFLRLTGVGLLVIVAGLAVSHWATASPAESDEPDRLAVLWTSGDPDVADHMALMYVHASQRSKWFDENLVIVWGPSAKLLAGDKDLQAKVKAMMKDGVKFQACIACANMYGVSRDLSDLGIEVKGMGSPLTRILKSDGWDVLNL